MKNERGKKNSGGAQPVLRFRTVLIGVCALSVSMLGPLALVWKQSYINAVSIRLENKAETLKKLSGEITSLKLESGRLASSERVERIASSRGFEYPQSSRMVILDVELSGMDGEGRLAGIFSRVKSFVLGERG